MAKFAVLYGGVVKSPRTATAPDSVTCLLCPLMFPTDREAVEHMKAVHLNRQPYLCMVCGERFDHSRKLVEHVQEHEGQGSLPRSATATMSATCPDSPRCLVCPSTFQTFPESALHMRVVHLNRHPYLCLMCGERFSDCILFATHVEMHDKDGSEGIDERAV